ncbi:MAG: DUF2207 domain-containing protein [Vicinamibacterales bacterium]
MRVLLRALVLSLAAAASFPAEAGADEGWLIERMDVRLAIQPDGSIEAAEAIDVDFRGLERHGIFRDLLFLLTFDETRNRRYDIDLDRVTTAEGTPHQVETLTEGDTLRFRIGDPDRTISGRETYRLAYRIAGALNGFPDHDELYWNATGVWPVTMERTSITVALPSPDAIQRVECFQGYAGTREPCRAEVSSSSAIFTATRPLAESEQVTIVLGFRKGVVVDPGPILVDAPRGLARFFDRTPAWLGLMTVGLAAAFGGVGALWWRFGRDRRFVSLYRDAQDTAQERVPLFGARPVAVEFQPPDSMRPGQMGLLLDVRADTLDVTATIIDLAVRGYIKITEIPKTWILGKTDWQLERLKPSDTSLLEYEQIVLSGLFGGATTKRVSELKNKFHTSLSKARESLYADSVTRGWFPNNPNTVRMVTAVLGIVLAVAGGALTVMLGRRFGAGLLGLPVIAGGLLLAIASRAMPRRTAVGRQALSRTLGFERYIKTAETTQQAFAERAQIFTAYLPYAIAFKCVDRWARAFSDIDVQAATAGWYAGSSAFDSRTFSSNLGSFSSSVSTTLASTPGGSGGSGFSGGSSGGGGGGGGGGSW